MDSFRLVPNDVAIGGMFWWPSKPSTTLTRVGSQEQPDPDIQIVLTRHIGTTGQPDARYTAVELACDIYSASVTEGNINHPGFMLKMIDSHSQLGSPFLAKDFPREAHYYTLAKEVQCIPRFFGLFTSGTLSCLVFEDPGRELTARESQSKRVMWVRHETSADCRDEAVRAFNAFEERNTGVAPRISCGTIRRGRDGRIKFSSLWGSSTRDEYTPEYMKTVHECGGDLENITPEELFQNSLDANLYHLKRQFR